MELVVMFANQAVFQNPKSRMQALGMDTRPEKAVVNGRGQPLFYTQTGGIINPQRRELKRGEILYRFVARKTPLDRAVSGGWWVDKIEFAKMERFAQVHGTSIAMAARMLCCVPPEWSDMGKLVRVHVETPVLAFRGLGNHVSIPMEDGLGAVKMTAHNDLASRRLYQLFIPGLYDYAKKTPDRVMPGALVLEQVYEIREQDANKGWLYLA
jgi:hypothetical protein